MRRCKGLLFIAGLMLLLLIAVQCGDDKTTIQSSNKVTVSGQVGVLPDSFPEDGYVTPEPYSVMTGLPAYLDFEDINESDPAAEVPSTQTDDSSNYRIDLEPGWYRVLVNTDRSFPSFFDSVHIATDTSLNFIVQVDFPTADSVVIIFDYLSSQDEPMIRPLTPEQEISYIGQLNEAIHRLLDTTGMRRVGLIVLEPMSGGATWYTIPVCEGHLTWEAYFAISIQLRFPGYPFPETMRLVPSVFDSDFDTSNFRFDSCWLWPDSIGGKADVFSEPNINL